MIVNPDELFTKVYKLTEDGRLIQKKDAQKDSFRFEIEECSFDFDFSQIWV